MKQKRKGLTRPRQNTFYKEYSFEIKVIILFTLGIFLLVEKLEIKQSIVGFIRIILITAGRAIEWSRDSIIFLINQFEPSDIVGISLILYVFYLVANRWRDRMIERYTDLSSCPLCGSLELHRIRKNWNHRVISILYFVSVKHYECKKCSHKEIKLVK